jgi:hypothetical protein
MDDKLMMRPAPSGCLPTLSRTVYGTIILSQSLFGSCLALTYSMLLAFHVAWHNPVTAFVWELLGIDIFHVAWHSCYSCVGILL